MDEALTNENIPPFLLNAIIDENTGEVYIKGIDTWDQIIRN